MNELGLMICGVIARTTLIAALGLVSSYCLKRRGPSAGALASLTTLAVLVGVAGLAFSPWPRWWSSGDARLVTPAIAEGAKAPMVESLTEESTNRTLGSSKAETSVEISKASWSDFVLEFQRELTTTKVEPSSSWRWSAWVACGFLVGLVMALSRLGLGIWAVRILRRRSQSIDDPDLIVLMSDLSEEMGLRRAIEVRVSSEIASPATIGWWKPVVLLPNDWTDWDPLLRRAVLAHELAHVLQGDYLAGLAAQFSLSVHFYHPLVHALAGRLRLQQELAADARGAQVSGGRRHYLTALASLALRQGPKPTAWPLRPFLPTRGTFLRRIEMLRDPNSLRQSPLSPPTRAITVAVLIVAGLMVAGFRGPTGSSPAFAQDTPKAKAESPAPTFLDPSAAASDVHLVLDIRPADILKNRDLKKVFDQLPDSMPKHVKQLFTGEIAQILVLGFDPREVGGRGNTVSPQQFAIHLRAGGPIDWKPFLAETHEVKVGDVTYFRAAEYPGSTCLRLLDERTLMIGSEADVQVPPLSEGRSKGRQPWLDAWKKLTPGSVRVAFDTPWMVRQLGPALAPGRGNAISPVTSLFGPLFDKSQAYGLTLDAHDGLTLAGLATCGSEDGASRVADTCRAVLALAKNAMPNLHQAAEQSPRESARPLVDLVDALEEMLAGVKVEQNQSVITLQAKADAVAVASAAKMLLPAVQANQEMNRRVQCVNNQKQIMLAMHNYNSANDCFPPAVLYGPDGKTPYSWRVALLPYLEQMDLYKEYKFEEPWDGPNNIKLVAKMPTVFTCPDDDQASKTRFTSYFVLTGPDTLFPARKEGTKIQEVTDGISNTIALVEAKRQIPWTKPEDLPLDKDKPLPVMGELHPGGCDVGFGDGSVRFLKDSIDKIVLRALFTRNSGEVISSDRF